MYNSVKNNFISGWKWSFLFFILPDIPFIIMQPLATLSLALIMHLFQKVLSVVDQNSVETKHSFVFSSPQNDITCRIYYFCTVNNFIWHDNALSSIQITFILTKVYSKVMDCRRVYSGLVDEEEILPKDKWLKWNLRS